MKYDFKKANRYLFYKRLAESDGVNVKDMLEAMSSGDFHSHLEAVRLKKRKRVASATRLCKIIERRASLGGIKEK